MGYLRMAVALAVTVFLIVKITNKKELMIPFCAVFFFVLCINDIFWAASTLEMAQVSGISYQFGDMMLLVPAGVLVLDLIRNNHIIRKSLANVFIVYLSLAVLFSLMMGIISYGFSSEFIGDIRTLVTFIVCIIYFTRFFDADSIKKYLPLIDKLMLILLIMSVFLWVLDLGFGFHPFASQYNATLSDGGSTMRFIQSYRVLGIAVYALFLTERDIREKQYVGLKALVFICAVILFQHRTVWLALGLGLLMIIIRSRRYLSKTLFLEAIIFIFAGAAILLLGSGSIVNNIRKGLVLLKKIITGATLENTTASTRSQITQAVKADLQGLSMLLGRPFGYGYATSIGWNTSPHSGYIRILGRTGYFGLIVFVIFIIYELICMYRSKVPYTLALLASVAGFMYGYDFTWLCGIIIGCCANVCTRRGEWTQEDKGKEESSEIQSSG